MHLEGAKPLFAAAAALCLVLAASAYVQDRPQAPPVAVAAHPAAAAEARLPSGFTPARPSSPAVPGRGAAPAAERAAAPLDPGQRAQADSIATALRDGPTLDGCRAAESSLLAFARSVPARSSAWNWALLRARDCLRAPHDFRQHNALMKGLLESFPDDPLVRQLAGLQSYDAGRLDEAAAQLEDSLGEKGSFEAWEAYADAQLARALELRGRGDPAWEEVMLQAEAAALRALELADGPSLPLALHTVARTQLELGRAADAIQWADQAIAALQAGGSRYQAVMTAELYVFSGQVYFRAGQRDTGLAYMDQGIATAASAQQQAELRRIRDEFLRRHG
jgi:tetratricopeptide (TPR) repeat protein